MASSQRMGKQTPYYIQGRLPTRWPKGPVGDAQRRPIDLKSCSESLADLPFGIMAYDVPGSWCVRDWFVLLDDQ
ncbi:hypothetical protein VTK73DRAFT_10086 [Phialemonium thermophilum]|uniref:Uncharacterized protein n=1 Tax=Phialemonium thermophilum TaxID=223376 RepID=A0ABR3XI40_9PEZI